MIWFSRAVPERCREAEGKPLIQFSLGTSNVGEARRLARAHAAEQDARWYRVVRPVAPMGQTFDPEILGVEIGHDDMLQRLREDQRGWPADRSSFQARLDNRRADKQDYARCLREGRLDRWEALADKLIKIRELPIQRGTDVHQTFVHALAVGSIDALERFIRESEGDLAAGPTSELVIKAKKKAAALARPGESIAELYEAYTTYRGEPGRKHRRRRESMLQDRVAVDLFAEFIGPSRSLASVAKEDARSFRSLLAKVPARRANTATLRGLSLDETIRVTERDNLARLTLITQQKYLSIISPFLRWVVSETDVGLEADPFAGLHHHVDKGANPRPPFSADDLITIMRSPLFSLCGGKGKEHRPGTTAVRDWRFWIPLLCMFTGSRITEVAQLSIADIDEREGVALAFLVHDEKSGKSLKNKKRRMVALHSHLSDAGFLEYVRVQRDRADGDQTAQLFPELKAGSRMLLGQKPSAWWRKYLERIGIKDGADGVGSHSFRHTMADAMRRAGYMDMVFGQLVLGHSNNTITAGYGHETQGVPRRLLEMIEAAFQVEPFKAVDFSVLSMTSSRND